jgi:ABC-type glutathione transport system ATPase component
VELSVVKMGDNLISVNNVSVNFDYQENFISKKQKIHAVNNINIKIKKGSFFWFSWRVRFRKNYSR